MTYPMTLSPKTKVKNQKLLVFENIAKALISHINEPNFYSILVESLVNSIWSAEAGIYYQWISSEKKLALRAYSVPEKERNVKCPHPAYLNADEWIPGELLSTKMAKCFLASHEIHGTYSDLSAASKECIQQIFGREDKWFPVLGIPVYTDKKIHGIFILKVHRNSVEFYNSEQQYMQLLAGLIATSIETAEQNTLLETIPHGEQVDQLRAEALAILSHEMRTPLASIKGYATALMLDEVQWSDEKRFEFLQLIDKETDNLKTMINEILDSSLIDIGQFMLEFQPVRLNQIARTVAEEMQQHSEIHHIAIDFPNDFPIIDADHRRITQVIRNIIDNAIKYSPDGGLILIRGEKREKDVVISISDTGVGISPEDLIPLFDKYFRVKSPTGYYVPGTGLGLPVARALIEEHQGRIWAESQVKEGTILYFSLPLSQFDQE